MHIKNLTCVSLFSKTWHFSILLFWNKEDILNQNNWDYLKLNENIFHKRKIVSLNTRWIKHSIINMLPVINIYSYFYWILTVFHICSWFWAYSGVVPDRIQILFSGAFGNYAFPLFLLLQGCACRPSQRLEKEALGKNLFYWSFSLCC